MSFSSQPLQHIEEEGRLSDVIINKLGKKKRQKKKKVLIFTGGAVGTETEEETKNRPII